MNSLEEYTINFFNKHFNIDLTSSNKYFTINQTVIPNFFKYKPIYFNHMEQAYENLEFARILLKIFGNNFIETKLSYYETDKIQIQENDVVFDCGGNLGIFAAYAASKGAKVYSFEPGTLIRHYLREVQKIYPNNIIIIPYGLSNNIQTASFVQYDNPAASRISDFICDTGHEPLYTETVNIITLDAFYNSTKIVPNFIKMDIEGAEIKALEGMGLNLKEYHPKLSISIHHNNQLFINYVKSIFDNYNFIITKRENYDPVMIGAYND